MADVYQNFYNPDVLSCLANLSNDEVFTPPEVANRMLDLLPQELFRSPDTTFLDPACKSGVFLREIAKRLLVGLENEIPDLQHRVDHIFHKQLYGIAITELTSLLSRRSVYCSKYPNSKYSITHFDDASGNIEYKRISHRWSNGKCAFCGAFNDSLMNDAVYKFKRYEDASLSYTGINRHEGEDRGGWDTVLSDADYNKMFTLQQASMEAPAPAPDDLPAKPYFTPDEDEPKPAPAKNPAPQPTKPIISFGGFTPKINTAQSTQASGSRIHKPSNSYTPRPASSIPGSFTPRPAGSSVGIGVAKPSFGLNSQPAAQPKPPVKVDVSKIKVGVKVKHKAFGVGTVAAIQPDMVTVRFGSVEKKFLLPAAIVQGYLTLIEE